MKIEIDTHTHTVLSGHAHSTILENAHFASQAGLKGFVITEHGPRMPYGPFEYNIITYDSIPGMIEGVRIYRGIEADILDFTGETDVSEMYLKRLDFVLASLHDVVIKPGTMEENTNAVLGALQNPYIDCIGHPGNPYYPLNYTEILREAKRCGKILEINNQSFVYRKGSRANCLHILELCKKNDVRIAVSSDAHICFSVGEFAVALSAVKNAGVPEELIMNRTMGSFEEYLKERKERLKV